MWMVGFLGWVLTRYTTRHELHDLDAHDAAMLGPSNPIYPSISHTVLLLK